MLAAIDTRIRVEVGDITVCAVDASVNAANCTLLGGGGVDGAIHRAAGPQLLVACAKLCGCRTGEAKWTPGFRLPAKSVIHTPGPVWHGGCIGEDAQLASCYRRSLEVAMEHGATSIAFPCISTGVYHFPAERAASIALATVRQFLAAHAQPAEVRFVCFKEADAVIYRRLPAASHLYLPHGSRLSSPRPFNGDLPCPPKS